MIHDRFSLAALRYLKEQGYPDDELPIGTSGLAFHCPLARGLQRTLPNGKYENVMVATKRLSLEEVDLHTWKATYYPIGYPDENTVREIEVVYFPPDVSHFALRFDYGFYPELIA